MYYGDVMKVDYTDLDAVIEVALAIGDCVVVKKDGSPNFGVCLIDRPDTYELKDIVWCELRDG